MKRRQFLTRTAAAAAPMIVPASVLGRDGAVAPNDRIALACIGVGGMGSSNLNAFLQDERVHVTAICDTDAKHREHGLRAAKLQPGTGHNDFREIVERKDIDAVMIATPDHWHAFITLSAANTGKDIYCEKPLAASIYEGRRVSDTVREKKRVLQCGTWRRSGIHTRMACELIRNGYVGDLKRIEVGVPGAFAIRGGYTGLEAAAEIPEGFDYALWQGPAPEAPYTPGRCHFNFRWVDRYAPGYITDWGAHFLDVAQWGLGNDDTGPVSIAAHDITKRSKGYYDAPESFRIEYVYANGVKMTMFSTDDKDEWGVKFVGSDGWVFTENERFETHPKHLRKTKIKDNEIHLYVSSHHQRNFIDSVLSRKPTAAPAETAHRAASACHLGTIAAKLRRPLAFDPAKERFRDDAEANARLARPMRKPWTV